MKIAHVYERVIRQFLQAVHIFVVSVYQENAWILVNIVLTIREMCCTYYESIGITNCKDHELYSSYRARVDLILVADYKDQSVSKQCIGCPGNQLKHFQWVRE